MFSEDKIQADIVKWFRNNYCTKLNDPRYIIFSVPNGGKRNKIEAMKLKTTGALAGVSDLIVVINSKVLFIEVKKPDGKQQPNQIDFENCINHLNHYYGIVKSLEDFKKIISQWI